MGASKERLKADLAAALRAKDEVAKTNIRSLLAAIKNQEVAGDTPRELSDEEELAVLTHQKRQREDASATYADAGRADLAEKEAAEATFIADYLPAPLTAEELTALVDEAVAGLGAAPTMKDMGNLVKAVATKAEGRAEGKEIATLARQRIQSAQ